MQVPEAKRSQLKFLPFVKENIKSKPNLCLMIPTKGLQCNSIVLLKMPLMSAAHKVYRSQTLSILVFPPLKKWHDVLHLKSKE